jgi:hypothetical protein
MWQHVLFARNARCFRPSPLRAHAYASPFFFSLSLTGAVVSCLRNGCAGMLSLSASFPLFRYAPQIYPLVWSPVNAFTNAACSQSACNAKLKHAQRNESTGSPSRRLCRGQEELGRCPCMTMACSRKHLRKADTSRSPPFSPVNTPNSIKAATRCHERFAFRRNGFAEQTCKLWIYAHLCRWHSILFQTCHYPELCHRRWVSAVCRAGSQ